MTLLPDDLIAVATVVLLASACARPPRRRTKMRLLLTTRKRTVLDVEILPRPTKPAEDKGPTLRANGGGQVELADTFGDPQTTASFGFCAPPRS